MFFHGEHEHSLDEKGRLIIPAMYRDALEDGFYLTRGLEGCLWLFPIATWTEISTRLEATRLTNYEARHLERLLYSGIVGKPDSQGRLMVPPGLRGHAGLTLGGPVTVIGVKNRLELWSPEHWRSIIAGLAAPDSFVAEKLAEVGV